MDVVAGPPIGPRHPRPDTPRRVPGSVRRTTTIDTHPVGDHDLAVDGRGRDLRTTASGAEVVGEVTLRVALHGRGRTVAAITSDPPLPELSALVGTSSMFGFRKALAELPDRAVPHGSLLHLLLDDLTGASLVAGYGEIRSGTMVAGGPDPGVAARLEMQRDLCAGWAAEGGMMQAAAATGLVPMPPVTPAPDLTDPSDPVALHAVVPLPDHGMRRRRRLDLVVAPDGTARFDVHFRDTYAEVADREGVLHEYALHGTLADDDTVTGIRTEARVLPWLECPRATASADRIDGQRLDDVRDLVRTDFRGTGTCTHLNDALRSLADLSAMRTLLR